tara:strand:- start:179 stop:340 length:162 start_codon:yes stop_codon:yes gene_type:complete
MLFGKIDSGMSAEDYNSHNTQRLDVYGMQQLLLKLTFVQAITAGKMLLLRNSI